MLFGTPVFILGFLPVALAGAILAAWRRGRRASLCWVLAASLVFYGWWSPVFVLLLVGSILVNYGLASKIRSGPAGRWWLIGGLAANLGVLGLFKYAAFLAALFTGGTNADRIILPLGISFFTFQQVMFLVDTSRGVISAVPLLEYACFVAFFPHLVAGPLVRPSHIIPQLNEFAPHVAWRRRVAEGIEIFVLGLAKKLVLADGFGRLADPGFAAAARLDPISMIEAWVALLAYALQIYFDFSGYSDMAIGLAGMFGISFPLNFNSPYKARNVSEFWQRWNITLSQFLRDYLYIPLGGNRRGEARRVINLMVTMLLGGLWHGAALRFVLWGGCHGVFLIVHGWFKRLGFRMPSVMAYGLTLLCVVLAWVPFRAPSFAAAVEVYRGLFGFNGIALPDIFLRMLPWCGHFVRAVAVLPYLGDARTLSLPQAVLLLLLGWAIVLGLPQLHGMTRRRRSVALTASLAFSVQALFFAPYARPFLYFQF